MRQPHTCMSQISDLSDTLSENSFHDEDLFDSDRETKLSSTQVSLQSRQRFVIN